MVSITPSVWYLALFEIISYGHTMYSQDYAYTDNIYCHECIFTSTDRFTGIYDFSGSLGVMTSTLKIPLLPVGLLLRLLSEAVGCLLLVMGMCVLSYSGLSLLSSFLRTKH